MRGRGGGGVRVGEVGVNVGGGVKRLREEG